MNALTYRHDMKCVVLLVVSAGSFSLGCKDFSSGYNEGHAPVAAPQGKAASAEAPPSEQVPEPPKSMSEGDKKKQALIAALVKKADNVKSTAPRGSLAAYRLATRYAPDNADVATKLRELEREFPGENVLDKDTDESMYRLLTIIQQWFDEDTLTSWPERTEENDLIELGILVDDSLVGDLRCFNMSATRDSAEKVSVWAFLHQPSATVTEVTERHGAPEIRETDKGIKFMTYGQIRLVADKSGRVQAVICRAMQQ